MIVEFQHYFQQNVFKSWKLANLFPRELKLLEQQKKPPEVFYKKGCS